LTARRGMQALYFENCCTSFKALSMYRATVVILSMLYIFSCRSETEKDNAEKINYEKFRRYRQKEAHFVVDILDTFYGLIDIAEMGEQRMTDPKRKNQVHKIIEGHTASVRRLKAYAEKRGITIPLTGPEKTKASVKALQKKRDRNFTEAWAKEMKEMQYKLKTDIEGYKKKSADEALKHVLDSTLLVVKENNEVISRLSAGMND
jgi:hypothetical protein